MADSLKKRSLANEGDEGIDEPPKEENSDSKVSNYVLSRSSSRRADRP